MNFVYLAAQLLFSPIGGTTIELIYLRNVVAAGAVHSLFISF